MVLWVEKTHGDAGPDHIAREISRVASLGDEAAIAMWRAVAERYDQLRQLGLIN